MSTSPTQGGPSQRQDVSAGRDAYVADRQVVNVYHHHGTADKANAAPVRLRVFVSWTSEDLHDHREQVRRALRRLGVDIVTLAPDTALDARSVAECLAEVRSCDLYLGLFAWRYGPVPEGQDRSLPELEFRTAVEANVPRLLFLLSDNEPWPRGAMDRGEAADRIDALRVELAVSETCEDFTTPTDLGALVSEAVEPWTRGDARPPGPRVDPVMAAAWQAYRQRLIGEYGRLDLEALTPPEREEYLQLWLSEVFVEPKVRDDAPPVELSKELWHKLQEATELSPADIPRGLERDDLEQARKVYRTRPTRAVFDVVAGASERLCVLLGDPGAGKSTIGRYLALALAEERTTGRLAVLGGHQPVLIELRDYALARSQCENFTEYLAYRARSDGLGLPDGVLDTHLNESGNALVIFDGLDEVFDPQERETVTRQIAWFASVHPTARILVTSRIIGYRKRILEEAGFAHHTLQDLNREQIEEFLTSWYGLALHDRPAQAVQRRQRLTKAIEESPPMRELAGNPLLLTILAIIGKHRELPRERWKVYDHAASVLVEHWDVNKHLKDVRVAANVIREDDKKDLLRRLAYRMQLGSKGLAGNHIWRQDLVAEIVDYLQHRFQYDLAQATSIANAMVDQFRERNFVLARFGPRVYGFVHRALLEFFCAGEIVTRFEKARTLTEHQLQHEMFETHWEDPAWTEVLRLVAGMLDATVTDRLLAKLLEQAEPVRTSALDRPPLGATALAVQCLAEVRNLGATGQSARMLLKAIMELLQGADRSFADERGDVLESVILPTATTIGPVWPGRELYLEWFQRHGGEFVTGWADRFAARILAALYVDTPSVMTMLTDLAQHAGLASQRQGSLLGVTETWANRPETRQLALNRLQDHSETVRQIAVEQLSKHWATHPDTLSALHDALLDPDGSVRRAVVEQLAGHWATHADTHLAVRSALLDPAHVVRVTAVEELAGHWATHPDTVPALHRATLDPNWSVRRAALQALDTSWAHTTDTLAVIEHATADADEDVRKAAIRVLARRWADHPGTLPTVLRAIRDPHWEVGVEAVELASSRWPDHPDTLAALQQTAHSLYGQVQCALYGQVQCASLVAQTRCPGGPADALPLLLNRLSTSLDEDVRQAAVKEVAKHHPESPEVFSAVLGATMDPDSAVRCEAFMALVSHWPGYPELKAACLRGIRDSFGQVRKVALEALARFWGARQEVLSLLLTCTKDPAWEVRRTAVETLAACWTTHSEAREALGRATHDQTGLIRQTILEALATGGADLRLAYTALSDPHKGTRTSARDTLVTLWRASWDGPEDWTRAMRSPLGAVRHTALIASVLLRATDPATWALVDEARHDNDPDVRLIAVKALVTNRPEHPDTPARVLEATRDASANIRTFALEALVVRSEAHPATEAALHRAAGDSEASLAQLALETLAVRAPDSAETLDALRRACRHSHPSVRRISLQTLTTQWADNPEALAAVRDCLTHSDDDVRDDALQALGFRWHGRAEVHEHIRRATRDPSSNVRMSALELLAGLWTTQPDTPELLGRAQWDSDLTIRRGAHVACALVGGESLTKEPIDLSAAVAASVHADSCVRLAGLTRLLLTWTDRPETFRTVRLALHDTSQAVHNAAFSALVYRWPDDERVLEAVHAALRDPSDLVRRRALWALTVTQPGDPRTHDALREALNDHAWMVREQAVEHIAQLWSDTAPEDARNALARMVHDQESRVRDIALTRLTMLFPNEPVTRTALARTTRDAWVRVRNTSLMALLITAPDDPLTSATLRSESHGPHVHIRTLARESLSRCRAGRTRDLPELARDAGRGHWTDRAGALTELVARWPDAPETVVALRDAISDGARCLKRFAIEELTRRWPDEPGTQPLLLRMVADGDGALRDIVIKALADGPDHPALDGVIAAATTDPVFWLRTLALHCLAIRRPDSPEILTALRTAATDPYWYVRYIAISLLHQRELAVPSESAPHWAIACDQNPEVRAVASIVVTCGPAELPSTPVEFQALWRSDADSKSLAAMLLAPLRLHTATDRAMLTLAAHDQNHTVHLPALTALATWWPDEPQTVAALTWATRHTCPGMRGFALSTLLVRHHDRDEAERLARDALDDPVAEIRQLALQSLHTTAKLDVATLVRLLADDDPWLVRSAVELLATHDLEGADLREQLLHTARRCSIPWLQDWVEWRREESDFG